MAKSYQQENQDILKRYEHPRRVYNNNDRKNGYIIKFSNRYENGLIRTSYHGSRVEIRFNFYDIHDNRSLLYKLVQPDVSFDLTFDGKHYRAKRVQFVRADAPIELD